jgi:hypothetical protein
MFPKSTREESCESMVDACNNKDDRQEQQGISIERMERYYYYYFIGSASQRGDDEIFGLCHIYVIHG